MYNPILAPTEKPRFAGFWIRVVATFLDAIPFVILQYALIDSLGEGNNKIQGIVAFAYIIYTVYFHTSKAQATFGMQLVGIYIYDVNHGGTISPLKAVGRIFASMLSNLLFGIGYYMIAFTQEKTALHDLICSTRVAYEKK